MSRRKPVYLTHHARQRWGERVMPTTGHALHHGLLAHAVLIPDRLAVPKWGSWQAELAQRRQGSAGRSVAYRVTASSILVCKGRAVATVLALPVEDLAQVLVWLMLGRWVDEPK